MKEVTIESVQHNLEEDWPNFIGKYEVLSQKEKDAYLAKQGYPTFSSLLAHVFSWWEESSIRVRGIADNPGKLLPNYDVDRFNAEAIEKNRAKKEGEILNAFHERRIELLTVLAGLSEAQGKNKEIQKILYWTTIHHYREHRT